MGTSPSRSGRPGPSKFGRAVVAAMMTLGLMLVGPLASSRAAGTGTDIWYVPADWAVKYNFPNNPYVGNMADPSVTYANGTYYAYSTSNNGNYVTVWTSTDGMKNWRVQNYGKTDAMGTKPVWQTNSAGTRCGSTAWTTSSACNPYNSNIMAPSVARMPNGQYLMVFTAWYTGGKRGIGTAVASSPAGPFNAVGTAPIDAANWSDGSRDPHVYVSGSRMYLTWAVNGGTPGATWPKLAFFNRILGTEIVRTSTGTIAKTGTTKTLVIDAPQQSWERDYVVENPGLVTYGGKTYLFYSSGHYTSANYRTGYAVCNADPFNLVQPPQTTSTTPTTPCTKAANNPLVNASSMYNMDGPGAGSPFIDASGRLRMIYAAWSWGHPGDDYTDPLRQRFGHVADVVQDPLTKELTVSSPNVLGAVKDGMSPTNCSNLDAVFPQRTISGRSGWVNILGCSFPSFPTGAQSITPTRVADTRLSTYGRTRAQVPAHGELVVTPMGRTAIPQNSRAVTATVTVISPTQGGYITAYPDGTARPTASTLNFQAGNTVPNMALVKLGSNGAIRLYNSAAVPVHMAVDITGYVGGTSTTVPGDVVPLQPTRTYDSRPNPLLAGAVTNINMTRSTSGAASGVPTSTSMVFGNLTATGATKEGWAALFPAGTAYPGVSSVNYAPKIPDRANAFSVKADGTGQVTLLSQNGPVNYITDVTGYAVPGTPTSQGRVAAVQPKRAIMTGVASQGSLRVPVRGLYGVPSNARAVFVNVSVVRPATVGYVTAYPTGVTPPTASMLNMIPGVNTGNSTFARIGGDGSVSLKNSSNAAVTMAVDVTGYAL